MLLHPTLIDESGFIFITLSFQALHWKNMDTNGGVSSVP